MVIIMVDQKMSLKSAVFKSDLSPSDSSFSWAITWLPHSSSLLATAQGCQGSARREREREREEDLPDFPFIVKI